MRFKADALFASGLKHCYSLALNLRNTLLGAKDVNKRAATFVTALIKLPLRRLMSFYRSLLLYSKLSFQLKSYPNVPKLFGDLKARSKELILVRAFHASLRSG